MLKCRAKHLILRGVAGTSKTYLALARGIRLLNSHSIDRLIIIRSAVEARPMGFLPGDTREKMEVYSGPYIQLVKELCPKRTFKQMLGAGEAEFRSTSYLRGVTFDNAYVLLDEYQNCNAHEIETVVTRIGIDTHLVLCGDTDQTDLRNGEAREHTKIIAVLESMPEFATFDFGVDDIVRSPFVKSYFQAKAKFTLSP